MRNQHDMTIMEFLTEWLKILGGLAIVAIAIAAVIAVLKYPPTGPAG